MVHHINLSWNTLEPSLVQMYEKLVDLGWAYYNDAIEIIEPESKEGNFMSNNLNRDETFLAYNI